jgi:CPA1 family monovalent cation:H+ antiporter
MTDAPPPIAELVASLVGLLLLAAATRALSKRLRLPFTVMLVVAGILVAQLAPYGPPFVHAFAQLSISTDVVLLIFLPTLIFESAFNLDSRQLRRNLFPILLLAVPGVLLSTAVMGGLLWLVTPFNLGATLILGALLSATDPVAVIALFKQLGAPKRLIVLVEGESLFNDATAIVLTRILLAVVLGGTLNGIDILSGVLDFLRVFVGGLLVGWVAALLVGGLLSRVENDPFIEVPLTVVLAYFSFLLAEEAFQVSGVMAVVAAGVVMGGSGRAKISPAVSIYLTELWEYFAFVANALIFLLVGLTIDLAALWQALPLLAWVVVGMLLSRLPVVFGLMPLAGRLPGGEPVRLPMQAVMYWGGLRGAIALALVLSLPELPYKDTFIALTAGAVLFTLLVQGLGIRPLVRRLGVDKPPLGERLAKQDSALSAVRHALRRIPDLHAGGLFSRRIARTLEQHYRAKEQRVLARRDGLRSAELDAEQERRLVYLRSFGTEKRTYYDLFGKGHLTESDYRNLVHAVDLQIDAMLTRGVLHHHTLHSQLDQRPERFLLHCAERFPGLSPLPEWYRHRHTARDYEMTWGQYQGSGAVLEELREAERQESVSPQVLSEVRSGYLRWQENARQQLDTTAEQLPEFVGAMQERIGKRLLLHSEREVVESRSRTGELAGGMAEELLTDVDEQLLTLRGYTLQALHLEPEQLLRTVPLFRELPGEEFRRMAAFLHPLTVPPNEYIIRQGETGRALFLIARGVIRVSRAGEAGEQDLGTLMAGDFFGEKALLHRQPRSATCRTVTACALYELTRDAFFEVMATCPNLKAAVEAVDRERA